MKTVSGLINPAVLIESFSFSSDPSSPCSVRTLCSEITRLSRLICFFPYFIVSTFVLSFSSLEKGAEISSNPLLQNKRTYFSANQRGSKACAGLFSDRTPSLSETLSPASLPAARSPLCELYMPFIGFALLTIRPSLLKAFSKLAVC